jgi:hypothetical protein
MVGAEVTRLHGLGATGNIRRRADRCWRLKGRFGREQASIPLFVWSRISKKAMRDLDSVFAFIYSLTT